MKVLINTFGCGEYRDDTLSSRMVDVRIEELVKELKLNGVDIVWIKTDESHIVSGKIVCDCSTRVCREGEELCVLFKPQERSDDNI